MVFFLVGLKKDSPYSLYTPFSSENGSFSDGDLVVASSSSVLILIVVKLYTDIKFPICESVDVIPIFAKASLALAAMSCERSFLYFM